MNTSWTEGNLWAVAKRLVLALMMAALIGGRYLQAANNPYDGYHNTHSYFLKYADKTSFAPGNATDVRISATIAGVSHIFNIDTGSRGLYASSTELGPNFVITPGSYSGEIQLSSSGRVSSGKWVPTVVSFKVTDENGNAQTVTSWVNILDVTTLGAEKGRTATFGVDSSVKGYDGTVKLVGGGTVKVTKKGNENVVELTHSEDGSVDQRISYAENIKGLIHDVSNFGIGFDLSGAPGGTGPVADNMNQIYNPLINLTEMRYGNLVPGYIITSTGIQLGLTTKDKGYAYTSLNSTDLTSYNSVPDWQTPMGQTVVDGEANGPGSVVMDSGIPQAYISAPELNTGDKIKKPISVYLMNSGGAVGYNIDLSDKKNDLNPSYVEVSAPSNDGTYSQTKAPYHGYFFNTGRNVFVAFNMLYDAQNGYMGVLPNSYGKKDHNIFFKAQAGGFPDPIKAKHPPVIDPY